MYIVLNATFLFKAFRFPRENAEADVQFDRKRKHRDLERKVVLTNLVMSRSRGIGVKNNHMALAFDGSLRSSTAEPPVKFQDQAATVSIDITASRHDQSWKVSLLFISETHPGASA